MGLCCYANAGWSEAEMLASGQSPLKPLEASAVVQQERFWREGSSEFE